MTFGFLPEKSTTTTCARKIRLKMSWMMVGSSQMLSARSQRSAAGLTGPSDRGVDRIEFLAERHHHRDQVEARR
jgi:hypothetical protein